MKYLTGFKGSVAADRDLKVLASTLPGTCDPSIAIATARGGGVGLLDLSLQNESNTILCRWAVDRLYRLAVGEKGLILRGKLGELETAVSDLTQSIDYVLFVVDVLTAEVRSEFDNAVRHWRSRAKQIGIVVTETAESELADHPDVDLIVLKGNEAGGIVGEETSFVLLQRIVKMKLLKPVYVWGGIGFHTASACCVAGVAGVVLDWQLALMRESPLSQPVRKLLQRMDGTETVALNVSENKQLRVLQQVGMPAADRLESLLQGLTDQEKCSQAWRDLVNPLLHATSEEERLWLIGQDACWASGWSKVAPTVGRAISAFRNRVGEVVEKAALSNFLVEGGPLAKSHGTTFPVVQGPMTRVSDVPEFCQAVEQGGGLPFIALAMLRGPEVRKLLARTNELMEDRPWGVGILGFVPKELRDEQLGIVEKIRPSHAIIAGGRPDQAVRLDRMGIDTYLHVPSPVMLDIYLQEGARRFIFEGRECGGHVGPRSSFVLWESMIEVLLGENLSEEESKRVHVLFAGGICDGLSGAMVTALAQPLVDRGMKVGVLLGTAYLFTEEATATGAIVDTFQQMAVTTDRTVLLQSSPGHAIRCIQNEYTDSFHKQKSQLKTKNKSTDDIREILEHDQLGRLRIASKGICRSTDSERGKYEEIPVGQQRREGMYMIGQVAPLCNKACMTIRQLHESVCNGSQEWLKNVRESPVTADVRKKKSIVPPPLDIAIIGMSCLLPGSDTPAEFWQNILEARDLLQEVPPNRFEADRWFDFRSKASDKINSKSGGFLKPIPFDPLKYGIPPASIHSIEPVQLLALELVDRALIDAGYGGYQGHNPYKERSSIILGAGGGAGELSTKYVFRSVLPQYFDSIDSALLEQLPEWTEDSFAGILMNVIAGRIANRFDFGGVNFTVDAACASSLASIYLACRELSEGTSDLVIAGGCDTGQTPFGYLCFASAGALSSRGKSRPFDQNADGIAISEGLASVVLKRLSDAERDGDRIYSVIRAAAGGSDGRSMGMTAPRIEGQVRTFQRAYKQARFSPATVGLYEAHGTGTAVGDRTECQSLNQILRDHDAPLQSSAIGSVKSNIGHTKCTAGVAGLMKASLSLYHHVLPPTIHVESLDPKGPLVDSPLYANTELRPWIRSAEPRRAGVSSFGFGGTNFHVVMQEYDQEAISDRRVSPHSRWTSELCLFSADDCSNLIRKIERFASNLGEALKQDSDFTLANIAYTLFTENSATAPARAAIVAKNPQHLLQSLQALIRYLSNSPESREELPEGVHYTDAPLGTDSPLTMLFPGQGSQSPNMLRDLAIEFDEVADCIECADAVTQNGYDHPLNRFIYPVPTLLEDERAAQVERIKATNVAQPALGACSVGVMRLLAALGVQPAVTAGHSYGELVALHAAGCLEEKSLYRLSYARGRAMSEIANGKQETDLGSMLAVAADERTIRDLVKTLEDVWIANLNSPSQTVISGTHVGLEKAEKAIAARGLSCVRLPVACAFHSPIMAPARSDFEKSLRETEFYSPNIPVYANVDATEYSSEADEIRSKLSEQLLSPVQFVDMIERTYASGSRVFLEVGPSDVLTRLVGNILADKLHVHIATQPRAKSGVDGLLHCLAELFAHRVDMKADRLFTHRNLQVLDFSKLACSSIFSTPNHCWLVDGAHSRPANESAEETSARLSVVKSDRVAQEVHSIKTTPDLNRTSREAIKPTSSDQPREAEFSPPPDSPVLSPHVMPTTGVTSVNTIDPASDDEAHGDPYNAFQETMRQFLETQQAVMTAYLAGAPAIPEQSHGDAEIPMKVPSITREQSTTIEPSSRSLYSPETNGNSSSKSTVNHSGVLEKYNSSTPIQPEPAPAAAQTASQDLIETLTSIVSEKTGYPADMLEPKINLESELGIDSIKRVEIIAAFRRTVLPELESPPPWFMESMTSAKTIDEIANGLRSLIETTDGGAHASPGNQLDQDASSTSLKVLYDEMPRCVVEVIDAPLDEAKTVDTPSAGVILLTDDGHGIAESFSSELIGAAVEILDDRSLTSRESALEAVDSIRSRYGEIAGAIDLRCLRSAPSFIEMAEQDWFRHVNAEVKGAFFLLQALAPELNGGSFFAGVTIGGGDFGKNAQDTPLHPWRGGLAGILKCAAKEWPQSRFRAIDIDDQLLSAELIHVILKEWQTDSPVEIGYRKGRRLALQAVHTTLKDATEDVPTLLDSKSVALISGGARGITAQIAIYLAQQVGLTLVLLGRSPQPKAEEDPRTAGIQEPEKLRQVLLEQARESGTKVIPKDVESKLRKLLAAREIRETLKAISEAGSKVVYESCDVRDAAALEQLVKRVQVQFGPINAVLHGAGIIEDKYIIDKTSESFDRVVETKTSPVITLVRVLDPKQLKLLMLFSSVAGFYGNPGQSDYAAANEMLNRLASYLNQQWPGKVVAMNWGPWSGAGMVTPEVAKQFDSRGIEMVSVPAGQRAAWLETLNSNTSDVSVLVGAGPWVTNSNRASHHEATVGASSDESY